MKSILVRIDKKTGKVSISAEGYTGAECLNATKKLEQGLGLLSPEREMKPEFFEEVKEEQQVVDPNNPFPKGRWT